jgi:uncharacterized protein (DUF2236 family)
MEAGNGHRRTDSVAWKINREAIVVLGWGRAILLQIAHPLVAQGVSDHSQFGDNAGQYLQRALRTVGAMLKITFGSDEEARVIANRINAIHDRVNGTLREPTRAYRAGTPYAARDPELLRWVHATLVDSLPFAYEQFVGPLGASEKDQYCAEAAMSAPLFGLAENQVPRTTNELSAYMQQMRASGAIEVTANARSLAQALLSPRLGPVTPVFRIARLATVGLLPPELREGYEFEWDARRERAFNRLAKCMRGARSILPPIVREWPQART